MTLPFIDRSSVILLALGFSWAAPPVLALPFEVNEDIRGVWNTSVVVAAAVRARSADKQLVGQGNASEYPGAHGAVTSADDGNLNYQKGDLISAPLVYTTDLELRYKNRFGGAAQWVNAEVISVECEPERCAVALTVKAFLPTVTAFKEPASTTVRETWIKEEGAWWYYQRF